MAKRLKQVFVELVRWVDRGVGSRDLDTCPSVEILTTTTTPFLLCIIVPSSTRSWNQASQPLDFHIWGRLTGFIGSGLHPWMPLAAYISTPSNLQHPSTSPLKTISSDLVLFQSKRIYLRCPPIPLNIEHSDGSCFSTLDTSGQTYPVYLIIYGHDESPWSSAFSFPQFERIEIFNEIEILSRACLLICCGRSREGHRLWDAG